MRDRETCKVLPSIRILAISFVRVVSIFKENRMPTEDASISFAIGERRVAGYWECQSCFGRLCIVDQYLQVAWSQRQRSYHRGIVMQAAARQRHNNKKEPDVIRSRWVGIPSLSDIKVTLRQVDRVPLNSRLNHDHVFKYCVTQS